MMPAPNLSAADIANAQIDDIDLGLKSPAMIAWVLYSEPEWEAWQ